MPKGTPFISTRIKKSQASLPSCIPPPPTRTHDIRKTADINDVLVLDTVLYQDNMISRLPRLYVDDHDIK
jgi:hypothetical protein